MKKVSKSSSITGKPDVPDNASHVSERHPLRSRGMMTRIESEASLDAATRHRPHENRNIMLYWDESPPPSSISSVLEKWQVFCPDWNVTLYNFDTASRFLYDNFEIEILRLFSQCAIPAMRSDFFRVFWAISEGGIYSDVTYIPKQKPLFFDENKNITMVAHGPTNFINGIFFAKKNCAELLLIAKEMINRIRKKKKVNNIAVITGAGCWIVAIGSSETKSIAIRSYRYVIDKFLDYSNYPDSTRNTENHWSNIQKHQSIYRKPYIDENILNLPAKR